MTDIGISPRGWQILVEPYEGDETIKLKSGVTFIKPESVRDADRVGAVVARVVSLGNLAYRGKDIYETGEPWCQVGDWVVLSRHAGSRFIYDGVEYRLINDDSVLGVVEDPSLASRAL